MGEWRKKAASVVTRSEMEVEVSGEKRVRTARGRTLDINTEDDQSDALGHLVLNPGRPLGLDIIMTRSEDGWRPL